jgi:hypothetical protein
MMGITATGGYMHDCIPYNDVFMAIYMTEQNERQGKKRERERARE